VTQRRPSKQIDALPEIPIVIVVDDDPEVREALSSLFRSDIASSARSSAASRP
jgi:FixJ family two-component response regulator